MHRTLCHTLLAGGFVLAATAPASTTWGQAYQEPSSGYQSVYEASTQKTPDAQAGTTSAPKWTVIGYTPQTAQLREESGQWLLHLDHTGITPNDKFNRFILDGSTGAGANGDFFTLDFRFRLNDKSLDKTPQLALSVIRPPNVAQKAQGKTDHSFDLLFSRQTVEASSLVNGSWVSSSYEINNDWHEARLVIDTRLSTARLYLDGSTVPTLVSTGAYFGQSEGRNEIWFGDGGSNVIGSADISSIRWTNQDMALPVQGGQLNFVKSTVAVEDARRDLNFPHAHRFADGALSMEFSVNPHMSKDEFLTSRISHDNGATWQVPDFSVPGTTDGVSVLGGSFPVPGTSSTVLSNGKSARVNLWEDDVPVDSAVITTQIWDDSRSAPTQTKGTLKLPFKMIVTGHRTLMEMADGTWLQTCNECPSFQNYAGEQSFLIMSADQGKTWSFYSWIATGKGPGYNGWSEPSMVRLADGTLLVLMRTDGDYDKLNGPLMQTKSTDNGKTWSTPVKVVEGYGVDPHVILLKNGALVASSGRPGVYMMVDITGTGDHWQPIIPVYDGLGSAYTTLIEVEPNVIDLFYSESGMSGEKLPYDQTNRIMITRIVVQTAGR